MRDEEKTSRIFDFPGDPLQRFRMLNGVLKSRTGRLKIAKNHWVNIKKRELNLLCEEGCANGNHNLRIFGPLYFPSDFFLEQRMKAVIHRSSAHEKNLPLG